MSTYLRRAEDAVQYQVGIQPDYESARKHVEAALGWRFVEPVDNCEGVWLVTLPHLLPEGSDLYVELTWDESDEPIQLTLEWP